MAQLKINARWGERWVKLIHKGTHPGDRIAWVSWSCLLINVTRSFNVTVYSWQGDVALLVHLISNHVMKVTSSLHIQCHVYEYILSHSFCPITECVPTPPHPLHMIWQVDSIVNINLLVFNILSFHI